MKSAFLLMLCAFSLRAGETGLVGSKVCGRCHAEIFRKYSATPMARSSGLTGSLPAASYTANSETKYLIAAPHSLNFGAEKRDLKYFVGSGAAARSYLIEVDNFLYEAPATYYSRNHAWAPSPGYDRYSYPFLTRAIAPGCLECHATGIQAVQGTQNGYRSPPFVEGGVGCERCHGPGARHVASSKAEDIVNPAALDAERRDSVCSQCHLSGEIRLERVGKSMSDFKAGERLSDYAVAFVRATSSPGMKVTSHVENLAQSACSRGSGGRLWCGTCHDPHVVPAATEKAAYFRSKCEGCHSATVCRRGPDCIACHMPGATVSDADHVVYTDHSIPRRPMPRNRKPPADAPLVAFGGKAYGTAAESARDQGLAYAIVALREQNKIYSDRAFDLLRQAERTDPDEPQTLSYLADLYKARKDDDAAEAIYRRLYKADPTLSSAPMNLGAYQMAQGHYAEAIGLFEAALRISPALVLVRLNLAVALIHEGRKDEARSVLRKALNFNPSFTAARDLLSQIR